MARHIMYIDESGAGSLNDFQSKFLLLTGLVVQEEEDIKVSTYFNYTKQKYGISKDIPFHSYDLFERKARSPQYLFPKRARGFLKSVSEIIGLSPIRVIVVAIKKDDIRKFYNIPPKYRFSPTSDRFGFKDLPYDILAKELFFWFARYLSRQKLALGHIIAEARGYSDHALLQTFLDAQEEARFLANSRENRTASKFKKRVSSISFEKKNGLRGTLEMADLISYFSYQSLQKNLRLFTKSGGQLFWKCIKGKMEKQKIQTIRGAGFQRLLPYVKARKLANYTAGLKGQKPN